MPSYIIPTVLVVGAAFVLFALADWLLWKLRDRLAAIEYTMYLEDKNRQEAHKPE